MRRSFLIKDGVKLVYNYYPSKNKPFLVFLHGLGANWSEWKDSLSVAKKKGYGIIALDLRGHGLSSVPQEDKNFEMERYALDVREILNYEKIKDYILIGHSFGGSIIVTYCNEFKDRLPKALVFVESTHVYPYKKYHEFNENPAICYFLRKLVDWKMFTGKSYPKKYELNITSVLKENWLFKFFDELYYTPLSAIFKTLDNAKKYSANKGKQIIHSLKNISIPTLIVAGKQDKVIDPKFSSEMHKLIPNSKLKIFDSADHSFPIKDKILFNMELFAFLSAI